MVTAEQVTQQGSAIATGIADLLNRIGAPAVAEAAAISCCAMGHATLAGRCLAPADAAAVAKNLRSAADLYERFSKSAAH